MLDRDLRRDRDGGGAPGAGRAVGGHRSGDRDESSVGARTVGDASPRGPRPGRIGASLDRRGRQSTVTRQPRSGLCFPGRQSYTRRGSASMHRSTASSNTRRHSPATRPCGGDRCSPPAGPAAAGPRTRSAASYFAPDTDSVTYPASASSMTGSGPDTATELLGTARFVITVMCAIAYVHSNMLYGNHLLDMVADVR